MEDLDGLIDCTRDTRIMLWRSVRLQEAGYYTEEGTPVISYKEVLYRVFRQRRGHCCEDQHSYIEDRCEHQHSYIEDEPSTYDDWPLETNRSTANHPKSKTNGTFWFIRSLVLLLLLSVGVTHYIHTCWKLTEVKQEVDSLRRQIEKFAPPANTLANFALESNGARVLYHLSSDTYWPQEGGTFWGTIYRWCCSGRKQRGVIQAKSSPQSGQCWPFSGDRGHLVISLSHPVPVTQVTLGHICKSQSPSGNIASAPRVFSVFGMTTTEGDGKYLGTMEYDKDGSQFQTFQLANQDQRVFRYVKLQIENNWGNVDYTCLYDFRVHAQVG